MSIADSLANELERHFRFQQFGAHVIRSPEESMVRQDRIPHLKDAIGCVTTQREASCPGEMSSKTAPR